MFYLLLLFQIDEEFSRMFPKHRPLLGLFEQSIPFIFKYASAEKPQRALEAACIHEG